MYSNVRNSAAHPADASRPSEVTGRSTRPSSIRFCLLGPVRAWNGPREIGLGSPQQRTTLAVLLLHEGTVVSIDTLVSAVWGDVPPRSAVTTIRTYVSRLRTALGGVMSSETVRIRSMGGGYVLDVPAESVDVVRFRRLTSFAAGAMRRGDAAGAAVSLRKALALRTGPALGGAPGPYVQGQQVRLQQLIADAEVDLVDAEVRIGRHREVIPDLSAMVAAHPMRERLQELLMTALYRSGRQAEALAQFQIARRALVDELGIEPGSGLCELHRRILLGDPDLMVTGVPAHQVIRRFGARTRHGRALISRTRTRHRGTR